MLDVGEVGESGEKVPRRRRKTQIISGDLSQCDFLFGGNTDTIHFFRMCPYDY